MEEKLNVKSHWNDVTVGEFIRLQSLKPADFENEMDYQLEVLSVLSNQDRDYFYNLPFTELPDLLQSLAFLGELPQGEVKSSYLINGKKYKAIRNIRELSAIQYIDIVNLLKDNEDNKNMHLLLAVILIEEGNKYNTEEYDILQAAEEISQHFRLPDAYALTLFFSLYLTNSIKIIKNYSVSRMKKKVKKECDPEKKRKIQQTISQLEAFLQNGGGCTTSTW